MVDADAGGLMMIWPAPVVEEAAALLGVSAWATFEDVKRAFHAKALQVHPDKVGPLDSWDERGGVGDGCLWPAPCSQLDTQPEPGHTPIPIVVRA